MNNKRFIKEQLSQIIGKENPLYNLLLDDYRDIKLIITGKKEFKLDFILPDGKGVLYATETPDSSLIKRKYIVTIKTRRPNEINVCTYDVDAQKATLRTVIKDTKNAKDINSIFTLSGENFSIIRSNMSEYNYDSLGSKYTNVSKEPVEVISALINNSSSEPVYSSSMSTVAGTKKDKYAFTAISDADSSEVFEGLYTANGIQDIYESYKQGKINTSSQSDSKVKHLTK